MFLNTIKWGTFLSLFVAMIGCSSNSENTAADGLNTAQDSTTPRIVSLNGSITELVYLLGEESKLVGVDVTSTFPAQAQELSNLGHIRTLNAEAVLLLKPTMVLVDAKNARTPVVETLSKANIEIIALEIDPTLNGASEAGKILANRLNVDVAKLTDLETIIAKNTQKLDSLKAAVTTVPKVLFIYARGANVLMAAGQNTPMDAMISLAGGQNAVTGFNDFQALTPEALLEAQPDVILMFKSGLASLENVEAGMDGLAGVLNIPGMAKTPAGINKRIITMDGQYLSGFGPRASQAALDLAEQLHHPIL